MEVVWLILFMALIGALIGGFTNHLAIKMLFRPHEAKYIGTWRVPFTPGLIPKRRDELARQMGRTVVEHLLTPETFKKRFFNDEMRLKSERWIGRQLEKHIFHNPKTLREWLALAGQHQVETKIHNRIDGYINRQFLAVTDYIEGKTVRELMPDQMAAEAEERIEKAKHYIIGRGTDFFLSDEGRLVIYNLIEEFLESRGRFGSMLQSLFGESETLVGKVQREIVKFLNAPNTYTLVSSLIDREWERLLDRQADDLLGDIDFLPAVEAAKRYVKEKVGTAERLDATVAEAWPNGLQWTMNNLVPPALDFIFTQGEVKVEETIRKMDMEGMVREQVDSFPLDRIEDLVLGISRREFKMITVLGAVLGGVIGIFQGVLVQLVNII